MVTGVEAAGFAVAILPLMLNQLDNYVQGLETLSSFRTKRYRDHLESCAAMLAGQHAILVNAVGLALNDILTADELSDLMSSPSGKHWKNNVLEDALHTRMGHDYDAFAAIMREASKILEGLSTRLNLEVTNPSPVGVLQSVKRRKSLSSQSLRSWPLVF